MLNRYFKFEISILCNIQSKKLSLQFEDGKLSTFVEDLITSRSDISINAKYDLAQVQFRPPTEYCPKSIFVRFHDKALRYIVWDSRVQMKKKGLIIEEWLTETRAALFTKLKELKANKFIRECFTEDGDVYATVHNKDSKLPNQLLSGW